MLQLSTEKETAKVNKASTARFQGRATPGTAVHDYTLSDWIGQIYILTSDLPYMRGVKAHYTVTRRKIALMCFVIAPIIS